MHYPNTQFGPCTNPSKVSTITIPMVQVQRAVLGGVNVLAKGHTPSKLKCWDTNLERQTPTPVFLNTTPAASSARTTKAVLQRCLSLCITNKTVTTAGVTYGALRIHQVLHQIFYIITSNFKRGFSEPLCPCFKTMHFFPVTKIQYTPEYASQSINLFFSPIQQVGALEPVPSRCGLQLH